MRRSETAATEIHGGRPVGRRNAGEGAAGLSNSVEPTLRDRETSDMEAGAGIEPANRGFADLDLTTWLPRRAKRRQYPTLDSGVNVHCDRGLGASISPVAREE
jgi:hypothetical protein